MREDGRLTVLKRASNTTSSLTTVGNTARVSTFIMEHVDPIFFGDPKTGAMKVLGA